METSQLFPNWSVAPTSAGDGEFAFAVTQAPDTAVARWQLDLPGEPQAAAQQLAQNEAQIAGVQRALDEINPRLERFIGSMQRAGTSYALPAGDMTSAEKGLAGWLEAVDPAQFSYGMVPIASVDIQRSRAEFRQLTERMLRLVAYMAWIETRQQGRLLARSVVGWSGDTDTVWEASVTPDEQHIHRDSMQLALASRLALLRTFIVVTQGAAKLAALVAAPGGALLALPAVWKFVKDVLAEVEQYQSITSQA